jgi:hypothetical protein
MLIWILGRCASQHLRHHRSPPLVCLGLLDPQPPQTFLAFGISVPQPFQRLDRRFGAVLNAHRPTSLGQRLEPVTLVVAGRAAIGSLELQRGSNVRGAERWRVEDQDIGHTGLHPRRP